MADLVTRLLLDDKQFDGNIVKSTRQIQEFQKAGSKVVGMLGKFAGTLGIAMGVSGAFNSVMRGSQKTSDAYDASMRACKTAVNEFFSALSTNNFSAFNGGLDSMIARAKEAYTALDQLANTMISFDLESFDNQLEFDQLMDKWRKEKDPAKKAALYKQLEGVIEKQSKAATSLGNDIKKVVETQIKESKSWYTGEGVSENDLRDIVKLDANEETRTKKRNEAIAKEAEFEKKRKEVYWKYMIDADKNAKKFDRAGYKKEVQAIAKDYQIYFAINKLLHKDMDDALTEVKDMMKQETSANLSVAQMKRKLHAKDGSYRKTVPTGSNEEVFKVDEEIVNSKPSFIKIKVDTQKSLPELEADRKLIVDRLNSSQTPEDYVKIKAELDAKDVQIEEFKTGRGLKAPTFTPVKENPIVSPEQITASSDYAESLNQVATAMGSISQMTNEGAAAWLTWGANIMTSVATAIPAITALIALKKEEAVANAAAEAAKTPIVGWLTVGAAVAAVAAAMFSIPKFATGGIVGGNSYSGDRIIAGLNSGEMVLNGAQQRNLFSIINSGSVTSSRQVEFKIKGNELVGVLKNYNKKMNRV